MALHGLTRILGIGLLLLAIVVVMSFLKPVFLDPLNISNLMRWTALFGILAVGVAFVIITGGIDLSIGSVVALSGIVLMYLLQEPAMNPWLAVAITLAVGAGIGLFHGILIGYCKLQSFVVTLCGLMAYRGLARLISGDLNLSLGPGFEGLRYLASGRPFSVPVPFSLWVSKGDWGRVLINPRDGEEMMNLPGEQMIDGAGNLVFDANDVPVMNPADLTPEPVALDLIGWVPMPMPMLILLVLAVAGALLLHKTVPGRYLLAMGRNAEAARFSGIDTRKMTLLAYVICSTLAALGGALFALDLSAVQPSNHGNFYELYAIAAAVLGGCSLRGGVGSIAGVVIGTAVMRSLYSSINLLGLNAYWELIIIGVVLLLGVMIDELGRVVIRALKTRKRREKLAQAAAVDST